MIINSIVLFNCFCFAYNVDALDALVVPVANDVLFILIDSDKAYALHLLVFAYTWGLL